MASSAESEPVCMTVWQELDACFDQVDNWVKLKKLCVVAERRSGAPFPSLRMLDFFLNHYIVGRSDLRWLFLEFEAKKSGLDIYKQHKATGAHALVQYTRPVMRGGPAAGVRAGWTVETSMRQLAFVKWVIESGVWQYCVDNYDHILREKQRYDHDMALDRKQPREKRRDTKKRRRDEFRRFVAPPWVGDSPVAQRARK